MPLFCPSCRGSVQIPQVPVREGLTIVCSGCNARLAIEITLVQQAESKPAAAARPLNPNLVLVAVIGEVTEEMISEVLSDSGLKPIMAMTADQVLERMDKERPAAAILDVGLQGVFDRIIPEAKKTGSDADMKIVLLSSIHSQARYKREPDSLYGADDYIERHHIEDQLIPKINKLLGRKIAVPPVPEKPEAPKAEAVAPRKPEAPVRSVPPPVSPPPAAVRPEPVAIPRAEPKPEIRKPSVPVGDLAEHDAAKRLARLIISDIALYNQKQVEEGVKNGKFHELLKEELSEGLKLYESRTPKAIATSTRYFDDAVTDFIGKQKARFAG